MFEELVIAHVLPSRREGVPEQNLVHLARRDVLVELAAMNCAFLMVEPDLSLFPNATRVIRHEDTREAEFLRDLLGRDTVKRKAAYVTLVTKPDFVRSILAPTFSAFVQRATWED